MDVMVRLLPRLAVLLAVLLMGLASIVPHHAGGSGDGAHHAQMPPAFDCPDHSIHIGMSAEVAGSGMMPSADPPACCGAPACSFDVAESGAVATASLDWSMQTGFEPKRHVALTAHTLLHRPPRSG